MVPGLQNFFIAVLPINGMLTSNFTMSYYINGQTFQQTNNFAASFWQKAIGILVGVFSFIAISLGMYFWIQKYGSVAKWWQALTNKVSSVRQNFNPPHSILRKPKMQA